MFSSDKSRDMIVSSCSTRYQMHPTSPPSDCTQSIKNKTTLVPEFGFAPATFRSASYSDKQIIIDVNLISQGAISNLESGSAQASSLHRYAVQYGVHT
jgi:hypothetical protein